MKTWSSFTPKDLSRAEAVFFRELGKLFPELEFSLADDPLDGSLLQTQLEFRGRVLGKLSARAKEEGSQPSEDTLKILPALADGLIEKLWLKKALTLDKESGLYNRDYFFKKLKKIVLPLDSQPRPLKLEDREGTINLALIDFRYDWGLTQRVLINKLRMLPGLLLIARYSEKGLALISRGSREEMREALEGARREALFKLHSSPPQIGFASYPGDLAFDGLDRQPHLALLSKAASALFFASGQNSSHVIAFGDLLNKCGRVTQVLPQDRAILNLGKAMGAVAGQVFLVKGDDGTPKGEANIFETAPAYSICHLKNSTPGRRISQGDHLEFLRLQEGVNPQGRNGEKLRYSQRERVLDFINQNTQPNKTLLFALAKLDDYEKLSFLAGEIEAEKQLDLFLEGIRSRFSPEPQISAPWEPGILAFAWGNPDPTLKDKLSEFLTGGEGPGKVSMGLVFWPSEVLSPDTISQAAKKTLLEAAMTGHEVAVVFGPQTLNISGDRLFDEGDLDEAVEEYRKGLILDPAHINLLNSLGVCYGRLGDQKAAIGAFDDILRLDPDNLMANFNKGCSYIISGKHEDAEKALEKAANLDPQNFEALYQLGKTALELGHVSKALKALNQAATLKGRRGSIHAILGQARLLSGDQGGAMDAFKQAVKYNPDDASSLSHLGVLYLEESKDNKMALSLFRRSVELDPSNSLYRQRLGKLFYDMGKFQDAEHHLKSALEYSQLNPSPELSGSLELLAAQLATRAEDAEDASPEEFPLENLEKISAEDKK